MSGLNLELFTSVVHDFEKTQYEILAELGKIREEFSANRIYPHLSELVDFHGTLVEIRRQSEDLKEALPRRITSVDLEEGTVEHEELELDDEEAAQVEDLIDWALPHIREVIEEGTAIYEFVDEHLKLETVGLLPSYVEEGYLFVPERSVEELHVLRYGVSLFTRADQRYRSLRTSLLRSVELDSVEATPEQIKLELIEDEEELPNPATYFFDTPLDFPFDPTILPVAKRKLLRELYAEGGAGGSTSEPVS